MKVTVVFKDGKTYHPRCELREGTRATDLLLVFWWPDFGIYLHGVTGIMDVKDARMVSSRAGTADLTKGKGTRMRGAGDDDGMEERAVEKGKANKGGSVDDIEAGTGDAPAAGKRGGGFPLDLSLLEDDEDVFEMLDVMLERLGKGPDTAVELRYDVGFVEDGRKIRRVVREGLEALKPSV